MPVSCLPLAAVPTDRARRLAAMLDAHDGRHDLDVEREGALEPRVVEDARESGRKRGIVLGQHGERRARRGKLAEHRLDHHARRAVALDDGDETVGDV